MGAKTSITAGSEGDAVVSDSSTASYTEYSDTPSYGEGEGPHKVSSAKQCASTAVDTHSYCADETAPIVGSARGDE